ncbi:MAG TPA: TIGR01212 family radical SAM protein [Spirochaetota bacterium]|nr:TIGR01212 family radical SAM protein [Spirochaetota bacterium]
MNWHGKRYYSYGSFLKNKFGEKIGKIPVDAGFSCPNRDGKLSRVGCIFCSDRGSGDFCKDFALPLKEQISYAKSSLFRKWTSDKIIVYFQPFSNTYGRFEDLKKKYEEALSIENVAGLSIATRPDCIDKNIAALLGEYSKNYHISVELGLQTIHQKTADFINRGYDLRVFEKAVESLKEKNIDIVVHLIFGLPFETDENILESVEYLSQMGINGVKLQTLFVLKNTPLEKLYFDKVFSILSEEKYIELVCQSIARLPKEIVIHRLTGDAPKNDLIAPLWSANKREILNKIDSSLLKNDIYQGKARGNPEQDR